MVEFQFSNACGCFSFLLAVRGGKDTKSLFGLGKSQLHSAVNIPPAGIYAGNKLNYQPTHKYHLLFLLRKHVT